MPEDLSLEERDELSNIRRRKRELLDDIEVRLAPMQNVQLDIRRCNTLADVHRLSGDY